MTRGDWCWNSASHHVEIDFKYLATKGYAMGLFSTVEKSSGMYLDQAANGNGAEKAFYTISALRELGGRGVSDVHVVEIGPGGGAALGSVTRALKTGDLPGVNELKYTFVELEGVQSGSLTHEREKFERLGVGTCEMRVGDAKELNVVVPDSADVVAASAVLHEVYSYGGGYGGIDQTLRSITDTLGERGFFSYRDVFSVERASQHERTRHIYDHESWVRFAKMFLPYYLQNAEHPYHREEDKVVFEQNSKVINTAQEINTAEGLSIEAPNGLLRELQRHYITLRDFAWRKGALGVRPDLEGQNAGDWLSIKDGHKRVHYRTDVEDKLLEALSEKRPDGSWVVDGDAFDATTDILLTKLLSDAEDGGGDPEAAHVWQEWLEREGSETYVYMTLGKFMGEVALQSLRASGGQRLLLPVDPSHALITPRAYYNRYLSGRLSNPLFDGKQLALFGLVDPKTEPDRVARGLDVLSTHCTKDTISKIYTPIRKVL